MPPFLIAFHTSFNMSISYLFIVIVEIAHLGLFAINSATSFLSNHLFEFHDSILNQLCQGTIILYADFTPQKAWLPPAMVFNWICPVKPNEQDPVDIIARVFNEYFIAINELNTEEDFPQFRTCGQPF